MLLSYCVVNTNGREHLLACLDAIERRAPPGIEREVLVLDNASDDGSADAVRARGDGVRLIALERREGKAANDTRLLREAQGRYCLLLNEDSELRPGAAQALLDALEADPGAAAAGAQLAHAGRASPSPAPGASRAGAPRSRGRSSCTAASPCRAAAAGPGPWTGCSRARCWSAARPPRRSATSTPTSSSTPTRPTSASRLADARLAHPLRPRRRGGPPRPDGHRPRRRPSAASSSTTATATSTCASTAAPRTAALMRPLLAFPYLVRALAALVTAGPRSADASGCTRRQAAAAGPRRGHPRGGGELQPRPGT